MPVRDDSILVHRITPGSGGAALLLGRKAAALTAACRLGLAIPPTFVLTPDACASFLQTRTLAAALLAEVRDGIGWLEKETKASLTGQPPLRLACRISPSRRTMGLADAALNLGATRDPFGEVTQAIEAAFSSWNHPLARRARQSLAIGDPGLSVIVQQMIRDQSGAAAAVKRALTRDIRSGKRPPVPRPLRRHRALSDAFAGAASVLEKHFADLVEFEYAIADGRLFILDARVADRQPLANVRITCTLAHEGVLSRDQALARIGAGDVMQFLLPVFSPAARDRAELLTQGLAASAGVAVGRPAFTAGEAIERATAGERIILVRKETFPEDLEAVRLAAGILTTTGGMTSHAALVARGWGKCCVVGAGEVRINPKKRRLHVRGRTITERDSLSLDGATGQVLAGELPMMRHRITGDLSTLLAWADERRALAVLANADTPADAKRARAMGAQGIGLCRTEHMFFDGDRITAMRQMILADGTAARAAALQRLLPWQRRDFIEIFRAMDGLPVTIRLIDPPLHEFLPQGKAEQSALARSLGVSPAKVRQRMAQLHEVNPMLGHRGCRLCVSYPELLEMQVRAIVEAAIECRRLGGDPHPRIMHPLVGAAEELRQLRAATLDAIGQAKRAHNFTGSLEIPIGTMIEVPRAALIAGALADHADFFSFGTNDLTQLTFGYSRDDAGAFLPTYLERNILPRDPFETLDAGGVGALIEWATKQTRAVKPDLHLSICGEHGGDSESIRFCHRAGLDAVSCSPFRVPVARLAAGQAAVM
jgi:pyruvate,orthophosphate dikinase